MAHIKRRNRERRLQSDCRTQSGVEARIAAINQYFLRAEMCEHWGYEQMAAHTRGNREPPRTPTSQGRRGRRLAGKCPVTFDRVFDFQWLRAQFPVPGRGNLEPFVPSPERSQPPGGFFPFQHRTGELGIFVLPVTNICHITLVPSCHDPGLGPDRGQREGAS